MISAIPLQAFLFDSAGVGEWMILLVVILIVVGPKRLPEVARKMGRMMETVRRAADEFKRQIMTMDQVDDNGTSSTEDSSYSESTYNPDTSPYPGHEGHYERPADVGENDYAYNPEDGCNLYGNETEAGGGDEQSGQENPVAESDKSPQEREGGEEDKQA